MSTATALLAENDQLRTALRAALKLVQGGPLAIVCPSCKARRGRPCYGNGPMAAPHDSRVQKTVSELERILVEASGINEEKPRQ